MPVYPFERRTVIPAERERDDHLFTAADQRHDHAVLDGGESGKTIQNKGASSHPIRGRDRLREKIKHLLICDKAVSLALQESLIQDLEVQEPGVKGSLSSPGGKILHERKFAVSDPVLHKFRDHRLYFRDHSRMMDAPAKDLQILFALSRDSAKQQRLSRIVEYGSPRNSYLFEDLVREPAKAQYVNIQDSLIRRLGNDLFLCLHRVLVGDNDHIVISALLFAAK